MKKITLCLITVLSIATGALAQAPSECMGGTPYNPFITSGDLDPAPLVSAELNGTGTFSFLFGLTTAADAPRCPAADGILGTADDDVLKLTICLQLIRPASEATDPVLDVGGDYAQYFDWQYNAGLNCYRGTQNQTLPGASDPFSGVGAGTITFDFRVTDNSSFTNTNNGFQANIQPAGYMNMFNLTTDDAESVFTYTTPMDFADLPDSAPGKGPNNYETLLANNGPAHQIDPFNPLFIGTEPDGDDGTAQDAGAMGDDTNGVDDEDIVLPQFNINTPNEVLTIPVTNNTNSNAVNPARLIGLFDWNGDGDFDDADEVSVSDPIPAGGTTDVDLNVTVNPVADGMQVYTLFRLTTDPTIIDAATDGDPLTDPSVGTARDGEVEGALSPQVLPVELARFDVKEVNCEAVLDWATASEENFSHFEVQRSIDGKTFEPVAKVNGAVNSLNYNEYRFVDQISSEVQYYRLKMVDLDATFEYSSIQALEAKCDSDKTSLTVFPSPLDNEDLLTVRFYARTTSSKLLITDMTGRQMMKINAEGIDKGLNELKVDISPLAAGVYFVMDELGNTERFVIAKQ